MTSILLAEDDHFLSEGLARTLRHSGYFVEQAKNGVAAEAAVVDGNFDLLILDLGLPQRDGLTVLSNLRGAGKLTPVLILTAHDSIQDRIRGLDLGANDYLCKPFNVGELEARIRALIRKDNWNNCTSIKCGSLCFDIRANTVTVADEVLDLSRGETLALEFLLQRRGRVVMKADMVQHFARVNRYLSENALDIVIHRLRKKIDNTGCVITTVKGLGFIVEN